MSSIITELRKEHIRGPKNRGSTRPGRIWDVLRVSTGRHAFTLIELLVVIAIIALLVSILVPSLRRAVELARLVKCQTNISGQLKAHCLYANEYDDLKPPIGLGRSTDDGVTPNVKQGFRPSGQGLLVAGNFIDFEQVLCPSGSMKEDNERDRRRWYGNAPYSGSSYVYFYRYERTPPPGGVTYQYAEESGQFALVIDINCKRGSGYQGAQHADRPWPSHPVVGRVNVGFVGGNGKCFDNGQLVLQKPGGGYELLWWDEANDRR